MGWVLLALLAVGLMLGFVVLFGPPYLPTMRRNLDAAFELLRLQPGQTILDLGCGDGRVLIAAATRGNKAIGIELSPILFVLAWLRTRRYRKQVRVIWGNYFIVKWPPADAIFAFMIPKQMAQLDDAIEHWRSKQPVQLASFAFQIPGKKPVVMRNGVFLYHYK